MEEFERIKELVEKSNKYCLYVELEDIKTLIHIIETMNKKQKIDNQRKEISFYKVSGSAEELFKLFEKHIPNIE